MAHLCGHLRHIYVIPHHQVHGHVWHIYAAIYVIPHHQAYVHVWYIYAAIYVIPHHQVYVHVWYIYTVLANASSMISVHLHK
jgi:hypothetical protein